MHPLESRDVRITDVTIINDPKGPNTDGIDVDSSTNVSIRRANVDAGDDCVVLKTTGRRGARPAPPTANVIVSDLMCSSDDQGIKIGTETLGDIRNVLFEHVLIYRSKRQYRPLTAGISISMVDGSVLENVKVTDVTIRDAATPFFLRLGNRGRGQRWPCPDERGTSVLSDIVASGGTLASSITGIPGHPIEDVRLSNIRDRDGRWGQGRTDRCSRSRRRLPACADVRSPARNRSIWPTCRRTFLENVRLRTEQPDSRPPMVLTGCHDDVGSRPWKLK